MSSDQAGPRAHGESATPYEIARTRHALDEHAMVSITNTRGEITYVNARCCEVSGYRAGELLGRNQRIFKSGIMPEAIYRNLWRTITDGQTWQGTLCNSRKDGSLYWVNCTIVPFLDQSGRPYQYLALRTDISEQKRVEQALLRQRDMQAICSQAAADLLACRSRQDLHACLTHLLECAASFLGADQASLLELDPSRDNPDTVARWPSHDGPDPLVPFPQLLASNLERLRAVRRTGRASVLQLAPLDPPARLDAPHGSALAACCRTSRGLDVVLCFHRQDQHWPVETTELLSFLAHITCNALHTAGITRDLQQRESDLATTLQTSGDAYLAVDNQARVRFANRNFARLFNLPAQALERGRPGMPLFQDMLARFPDPARMESRLRQVFQHGESFKEEVELTNGRSYELTSHPLRRAGRYIGRVWKLSDVTERVKAHQQEQAARREAEQANRAKSEFLSQVSHELRTPMNAILGFAQLLQRSPQLDSVQTDNVQEILSAGSHLLALIDEMLDLSRIEAGKLELELTRCDLRNVMAETEDLIRPLARERSISLTTTVAGGVHTAVRADARRLKQVLLNLLSNAIRYNHEGGRVDILAAPAATAGMLRVTVADTGPGLTTEEQARLFEPFMRFGKTRNAAGGTGIGLTISHSIMALMNGSLGVDSAPGMGSRFWIELPMDPEIDPRVD